MIANYHTHTPLCRHASGAVEEYAQAAFDSGIQILGMSDHTPSWFPEGPLGDHLRECCALSGASAWGFLCLDYAYYIRCNYLHGDKTTILFTAATDPELAAFRTLNVFLGEFLKEMIPLVFRENWFTEGTYDLVCPNA